MSKSQAYALAALKHFFQNISIPNVGDATGLPPSATPGNVYVAYHTADPGKLGDQTTNEAAWPNYARMAVVRSAVGWTCAGSPIPTAVNAAEVKQALACGGGSTIIGWFSVGLAGAGASQIAYSGQFSTQLFEGVGGTNDTLTIPGHNFIVNDALVFSTDNGETLPAGISSGTIYFVKTAGTDVVTISATQGGATLDVTASGPLTVGKITTLTVTNGVTASSAAGALVISED